MRMRKLLNSNKGQIASLESLVIGIVVVAIVLVVGFNILSQLSSSQTAGSAAYNATSQTITSLSAIPNWLPVIVVVGVAAVVLGFVIAFARRS